MSSESKSRLQRVVETVIAFIPWVISMYTLYWLDYGEIWSTSTPHRGKTSVAILATGMVLSLMLYGWLSRRKN